ncbi:uncharacterized protein LOC111374304 [Olea europaea var. sylvestris]|uniref:uncharacterized protein LOC111374304 n=1 Tax=Olea europaea var. sylvestris TaxID=158386 RepID=UPI000C1D5411|nr:uncharacterized protein LOC111374304 [Olea europaea var. sylvestris]
MDPYRSLRIALIDSKFFLGVLSIRYLGVPFISTKLRALDWKVLVDRIITRAKSWTYRALSCASRLQLIKSILFSIQRPGDCSWTWRKILGLRDIRRDKMKFRISNSRRASLWFDNWHPLGPLENIIGERIIHESRLSKQAKVADIIEGNTWSWPSTRSSITREDVLRGVDDVHGVFSLTIQGGLYTQTKLIRFVLIQSMHCVLCCCSDEDLDQLFFACPYSERIWHSLHAKYNMPWVHRSCTDTLSWMEQFRGRSLHSIVIRLIFTASILAIWHERNTRTHGEAPKHEFIVIRDIIFSICARVNLCRGLVPSDENRWLQRSWGFSANIFY